MNKLKRWLKEIKLFIMYCLEESKPEEEQVWSHLKNMYKEHHYDE